MSEQLPANATSPAKLSALPDAWIEKVFQKFEDFYGARWAALYGDFPRARVMATWAEELAGFAAMPECIGRAVKVQLASVHPPTLPDFMAVCRNEARRRPAVKALPVPDAPAEAREERRAKVAEFARKFGRRSQDGGPQEAA